MQEDLEAEFQSLFSLLEELKEGMLMKIKQDRASRTYELQVCQGAHLDPHQTLPPWHPPRLSRTPLTLESGCTSVPLVLCRFSEMAACLQGPEPDAPVALSSPSASNFSALPTGLPELTPSPLARCPLWLPGGLRL